MLAKKSKSRKRIHIGIRGRVVGTASRPRMAVYRSNKDIYVQLIDDSSAHTIASASSKENEVVSLKGTKTDKAKAVGAAIAKKASTAGINTVVFDRGGFLYHGRIKALAESAREGGLEF